MTSTTANKKVIVDFLWEWAESNGDWSKLLVSKIVESENELSTEIRQEVFNYFLQLINLHSGLPKVELAKPTYIPTNSKIELESLSEISGVNRLAKDQTVKFAKGVTIIYGENGVGKTGYSRILKSLGFSYDTNKTVLPNIFKEKEPQSATIKFESNGQPKSFTWNGKNSDPELEAMSVFNSSCVQFSIGDRNLIVSPIGFHLFNLISEELSKLNQLLLTKIAAHPIVLPWIENLNQGTPQQTFINGLTANSEESRLLQLSTFSEDDEETLRLKHEELINLNKGLLEEQIRSLRSQIQELGSLTKKVESVQDILSESNCQSLIQFNKKIAELETQNQMGLREIAEQRGIEFYQTDEFRAFIQTAENYIKILDSDYPGKDDACVYCLQPLDSAAQDLLKNYRLLLNDKTQEELVSLRKEKSKLVQRIQQADTGLLLNYPSFGMDENENPIQPVEFIEYKLLLDRLKTEFINDQIHDDFKFSFDYSKCKALLLNKKSLLENDFSEKSELVSGLSEREEVIKGVIAELKDRKLLSGKVAEIKACINNHKTIRQLNSNSNSFNTGSISRKTSEARNELIQQNFNDLFEKELTALRKKHLKIELRFGTDRGNSRVFQKISDHSLADILSEGEQKAIALAEFLTELQLDNIKAPVIFDDPVNSLDHRIIDEVAKRLIELSKQRQVVIFTHSILLLHSFLQQAELDHHKQAGVQFEFHRVKENFGVTGVLDEVEEVNSFSYYTKKLNLIFQPSQDGQDEGRLAAEGYGYLRSAIEIAVEDDLFKRTIKRYKKGVAFPALMRIDGVKIDEHKSKLNDIYEKCCVSIAGHSSPQEINSTPTLAELMGDYDEFKRIRKEFT